MGVLFTFCDFKIEMEGSLLLEAFSHIWWDSGLGSDSQIKSYYLAAIYLFSLFKDPKVKTWVME